MINLKKVSNPTRRVFLAVQACAFGFTGAAHAQGSGPALPYDMQTPLTWRDATPEK